MIHYRRLREALQVNCKTPVKQENLNHLILLQALFLAKLQKRNAKMGDHNLEILNPLSVQIHQ